MTNPKQGEIWLVNLDPTTGAEIQKTRLSIIVISDLVDKLPVKLVALMTDWKPYLATNLWHIRLEYPNIDGLLN